MQIATAVQRERCFSLVMPLLSPVILLARQLLVWQTGLKTQLFFRIHEAFIILGYLTVIFKCQIQNR